MLGTEDAQCNAIRSLGLRCARPRVKLVRMTGDALNHKSFLQGLSADDRALLTGLSDGPGLQLLAVYLVVAVALGAAIVWQVPGWPIMMAPLGLLLAFLFCLQHECTHKTPFRTAWLNEATGYAAGFVLFQPFQWFRYFHFAHHRFTNDPQHDPELLAGGKPDTAWEMLVYVSCATYWVTKIRLLVLGALGRVEGSFLPANARSRVIVEIRVLLCLYAFVFLMTVSTWPALFLIWPVPLAIGFPLLRLYLLAEHGRCAFVADMFRNTRTVLTNRLARFLCWNMSFHAEHHAMPSVPFHRLPELHERAKAHLRVTSSGYGRFLGTYVANMGK